MPNTPYSHTSVRRASTLAVWRSEDNFSSTKGMQYYKGRGTSGGGARIGAGESADLCKGRDKVNGKVASNDFKQVLCENTLRGVLTEGPVLKSLLATFPIDFVPYCIPLVLEKLSSDLHTAKVDALLTLAAGGSVFGEAGLAPHIEQLWPSIRKRQPYMRKLHDIREVLSTCQLQGEPQTQPAQSTVPKRPQEKHSGVGVKLMFSSCQLLLAVAMAADPACVLVVREVVPVLVQRLSQSQPAHRRVLVEMVTSFAGVAQQFGNHSLEPYKDMLLHTLLSALGGDQLELKAPALRLAACVFSMLSGPELQACVQCAYELAVNSSDPQLRGEARGVLRLVVKRLDANVVMALVSPLLMGIDIYKAVEGAMSLLAVLSHQQEVLVAIVPSLLAALEKPQTLQSAANLCGAVREVVEEVCRDPSSHPLLCSLLLPGLLQLTVCADPPLTGEETVGHVAAIVRAVTRAVDSSTSVTLHAIRGKVLEEVLSRDMASIWSCVGSPDLVVKANAISMAMWLAKALAMRGHIRAQDLVFKFMHLSMVSHSSPGPTDGAKKEKRWNRPDVLHSSWSLNVRCIVVSLKFRLEVPVKTSPEHLDNFRITTNGSRMKRCMSKLEENIDSQNFLWTAYGSNRTYLVHYLEICSCLKKYLHKSRVAMQASYMKQSVSKLQARMLALRLYYMKLVEGKCRKNAQSMHNRQLWEFPPEFPFPSKLPKLM
eukprot:Em0108g3a